MIAVPYLSETSGWGCAGAAAVSPDIPAVCSVGCCCCPPVCPFGTGAAWAGREAGVVLFILLKGGNEEGLLVGMPLPRLAEEEDGAVVVRVELAVVAAEDMALVEVTVMVLLVGAAGADDGVLGFAAGAVTGGRAEAAWLEGGTRFVWESKELSKD